MKMPSHAAVELARKVLDRYNGGDQGVGDTAPAPGADSTRTSADARAEAVAAGPAIKLTKDEASWPVIVDLLAKDEDLPSAAEVTEYLASVAKAEDDKDAKRPRVLSMAEAEKELALAIDRRDAKIAAAVERNLKRK
jgi:hypothetical protein